MRYAGALIIASLFLLGGSLAGAATNDAAKRNDQGAEMLKQGKLEEALTQFQQAVVLDPSFLVAQQNLAYVYDQLGRADEAIIAYKRAIELDPRSAIVFNNLGVLYTKKGQNEEAIQVLEQGLKVDPTNATLQKNLENAKKNRGIVQERETKIADAKKQADARPKDPQAAFAVARICAFYGQNDQALEWLGKSLELGYYDPERAKADATFTDLKKDPRFQRLFEKR